MTAEVMTRPIRGVFPGTSDQVRQARGFAERILTGCPVLEDAVLLTSELVTNAVVHTATGKGGVFEVTVYLAQTWLRIEVRDGGSPAVPSVRPRNCEAESGLGLGLVEMLARRWGHHGGEHGRIVWFELDW